MHNIILCIKKNDMQSSSQFNNCYHNLWHTILCIYYSNLINTRLFWRDGLSTLELCLTTAIVKISVWSVKISMTWCAPHELDFSYCYSIHMVHQTILLQHETKLNDIRGKGELVSEVTRQETLCIMCLHTIYLWVYVCRFGKSKHKVSTVYFSY